MSQTLQDLFAEKKSTHEAAVLAEAAAEEARKKEASATREAKQLNEKAAHIDSVFQDNIPEGDIIRLKVDDSTEVVAVKLKGVLKTVLPKDGSQIQVREIQEASQTNPLYENRLTLGQILAQEEQRIATTAGVIEHRVEDTTAGWVRELQARVAHFMYPQGAPAQPAVQPAPIPQPPQRLRPTGSSFPWVGILVLLLGLGAVLVVGVPLLQDIFIGAEEVVTKEVKEPIRVIGIRDNGGDTKELQSFAAFNDDPKRDDELKKLDATYKLWDTVSNQDKIRSKGLLDPYKKLGNACGVFIIGMESGKLYWTGVPKSLETVTKEIERLRGD